MIFAGNGYVRNLVADHPAAGDVLEWYGVDLDRADLDMTLGELCAVYGLDYESLVDDIEAADRAWDDPDDPSAGGDSWGGLAVAK